MGVEVVCCGETVVDLFARQDHLAFFPDAFVPSPGGAAVNVAVALTRLGVQSALLGKIGGDIFGRFLNDALSRENVDLRGLRISQGKPTSLTFVFRKEPLFLEPLFIRYGTTDMSLQKEEVSWEVLQETRVVHCVSLCLVREPLRSATWEILDFCRERKVFLSFDVNHRPLLWKNPDEAKDLIMRVAEMSDFLKLTREELQFLTGCHNLEEGVVILLQRGVTNCVVTLGQEGAFFANSLGTGFIPAFSVLAVDPTGCGDAFCAGILKEVLSRKVTKGDPISPKEFYGMGVFASACGALTAQKWGSSASFPTLTEVEQFLREKMLIWEKGNLISPQ
ncbi:MAG: carbohydrate kinase [Candidatus Atribacteria bacterium]|nr:carbohydrate kinase [Candidatus Atribacteria bacterium]